MAKDENAGARGAVRQWLEPDGLMILAAWARNGWDDERVAQACGVSVRTLEKWRRRYPELDLALRQRPESADVAVENALHSLAVGYTRPVRKTYRLKRVEYDERGRKAREWEELETGIDEVHVPASVTAQKFWLAHRRPGDWGDGADAEDGDGLVSVVDDIPEE